MGKIFCVDSDGSTMDTMSFKHDKIMGPNAVKIFNISDYVADVDQFLRVWSKVNLRSPLRGANRFVALLTMLKSINYPYIRSLSNWVEYAERLSMESLQDEINRVDTDDLKLALRWSAKTNKDIASYEGNYKAFPGARETLAKLSASGKVYAVSTSNRQMIQEEWIENGLDEYTTDYYCQEAGPKADTINQFIQEGTDPRDILIVGDSHLDLEAAEENDVCFYPILVGKEKESWHHLQEKALSDFLEGSYDQNYYTKQFKNHLSGN